MICIMNNCMVFNTITIKTEHVSIGRVRYFLLHVLWADDALDKRC